MLVQGMNYRLPIKKGLLTKSKKLTIASNQQSALDFYLFNFPPALYYRAFFLYSGLTFFSLLCLIPMLHLFAFISSLCQSIATNYVLCSLNESFLLCKEHL